MSMSKQGNKRAGDNPSASDGREEPIPKCHRATAKSSTAKELDSIEELQKIIEKVLLDFEKLPQTNENMKFINELRQIKTKMEENQKEKVVVGVLGRTGAGKSSLVNAILGKKLLPAGTLIACTSVIIELEANMANSSYEAEIQFISEEEWKTELNYLLEVIFDEGDMDRPKLNMARDKIQALYGKNGVGKDFGALMKMKNFSKILALGTKNLVCDNASEFSKEIECYIRSSTKTTGNEYWPLVKFVRIKIPDSQDLLEHVVLTDVPGTGDWNTARDKMWEQYLCKCSYVWVVADIDRACSDNPAWDILDSSVRSLGPGGECRMISFICTKTDNVNSAVIEDDDDDDERSVTEGQAASAQTADERKRQYILARNAEAKIIIERNAHVFKNLGEMEVFTVSAMEFQRKKPILSRDDTEIPKLRDLLKKLNDQQSKELTNYYIMETYNIISRIQLANSDSTKKTEKKKLKMKRILEANLTMKLEDIKTMMSGVQHDFRELLSTAADESVLLSETRTRGITKPVRDCRGYHKTLKAICKGQGYCRSGNGEITDMNTTLTQSMYDAIDGKFQEIFSMRADAQSILLMIKDFDIISESLKECMHAQHLKYIVIKQLKAKLKLVKYIIQEKKRIYNELKSSIRHTMQPAYAAAAEKHGKGSMERMRDELENRINSKKSTMFHKAMESMLTQLEDLGNHLNNQLRDDIMNALMQPLNTPSNPSLPDVSEYYEKLKKPCEDMVEALNRRQ